MGLSVLQLTMVAVVGILATMSILKARQYHAQVNQQMEMAERAIQEKDTVLTKCENDRTEAGNAAGKLKDSVTQITNEKDASNKKAAELEGQIQGLTDAQNQCSVQLAEANGKVGDMEFKVLEGKNATDATIAQLQADLKKAQDDLTSKDGALKDAQEKLAAAAAAGAAAAKAAAPAAAVPAATEPAKKEEKKA